MNNGTIEINDSLLNIAVFQGLAGDCIYVMFPNGNNILVDAGFHKGNKIINAIKKLPGKLKKIIITHQHLDHFATLGKFIHSFSVSPEEIYHSGMHYKNGFVPKGKLSTCEEYEDLELSLWYQYTNFIKDDNRWRKIDIGDEDYNIVNLLPENPDISLFSNSYYDLNYSATPIAIITQGKKIIIGSDIYEVMFKKISEGEFAEHLKKVLVFFPSSHGRPSHNPKWLLETMSPQYICINDSFKNSDFRAYYQDVLPTSDVRSCNVDGSQFYSIKTHSIERFNFHI